MAKTNSNAETVLLDINVTGREQLKDARSDAKALTDELGKSGKADMSTPTKSLKQQLREAIIEAQKLEAQGKANTKEFRDAAKNVAGIKDRIEDLNRTFKAFDPDNKFKVFATAAGAGAKIVQGYAGAMAFLGVNSEDAAKTIAKLQGIMAFTDAIGSLHDLKDSYKDLLAVLGLNTSAASKAAAANSAQADTAVTAAETTVAANESEVASIVEVQTADEISAAAQVASQKAVDEARAAGVTSLEALIAAGNTAYETTIKQAEANNMLAASQVEAATTADVQAVALEGAAVAEDVGTASAFAFGAALKAIGIGLIISAIAYLISNFQSIKKAVTDLFPGLKTAGTLFNTIKEVAFGVGNVLLQFVITPIKILIDVIKGDFKAAIADFKKGIDVIGNFKAGEAYEAAQIAADAAKKRVALEIEANERIIKERKALGKDTAALEQATLKLKISQLDKDKLSEEDFAKQKLDLESDITVALNTEWKKRHDKYVAALKTDLDAIKANEKDNLKLIQAGSDGERKIALSDVDFKFAQELKLLEKRKGANKNYNKDLNDLLAAKKVEETRINKKYDDVITEYKRQSDEAYLDEYEKKAIEINKKADDALKAASTMGEKNTVEQTRAFLLNQNKSESVASAASKTANVGLTRSETKDKEDIKDDAHTAISKVDDLEASRLEALNASYALEKAQKEGQQAELEQLAADHEAKLVDITNQSAEARKAITKAEQDAKLASFDIVANAADAASQLVGESTVAGKALAIAAATISTYTSAQKAYESTVSIPFIGPELAIVAAASAVAIGIANVKKILSVKVPSTKGGASGSGGAAPVAPVINSTVLNQASNGSNNVTKAITTQTQAQKDKQVRAYIVNKDLQTQAANDKYYNNQSTY